WQHIQEQLCADAVDLVLISPERLANDNFLEDTLLPIAGRVGLFVVDEAHCISDWGHDFRPDYRRITRILQLLPANIPLLATTATANDRVVRDVLTTLGSKVELVRGPLARESLRLQTICLPNPAQRLAWLAEQVPQLPGSGIIYTLTIRDAQRVAAWLQSCGIDAQAYWGSRLTEEREALEEQLLDNRVKTLVATTALGMGFDKPDLGFVIHFQRPGSVVHYYQQVGRAGRAMKDAYGILLHGREDSEILEYFMRTAFPPQRHIDSVLQAVGRSADGLSLPQLEREVNLARGQIEHVLTNLSVQFPAPISKQGNRWYRNPVPYTPDPETIRRLTYVRRREQARMTAYLQSRECLMQFLAAELDDPHPRPCGRCASCVGAPLLPETAPADLVKQAIDFLQDNDQPLLPRRIWPVGGLPIHAWQGTISPALRVEPGRTLCVWGDDGWGDSVRRGKTLDNRFDDALVTAAAALIQQRWHPNPPPLWVTAVPSLNHPELVPDFARRLAAVLRLPFRPCIRKVRQTRPQKEMENSYLQATNLDGAFQVLRFRGIEQPVLLVDDMVDSGWTFTVVGALLREAGSGQVHPLALASTSKNMGA
ncbi:MAG TPA: helicase-related protein, partial [Chloroflexota bacterium]